jgi:hypothetical protein
MTEKAKAYCDALIAGGLSYGVEFVPQSKSRNADKKEPSLNWRVTISKNGRTLSTDYMQGVGHLPNYSHAFANLVVYDAAVRDACEHGKSRLRDGQKNGYDAAGGEPWAGRGAKPIPPPTLGEVLYCLVLDSDVIDYPRFEEWAENCGYDADSRSAEKIYRQCLEIGLALRQMIDIDAAREAFQDY